MAENKLAAADIIEAVEQMTVLELAELVKALEDRFGVIAAAPVMAAPTVAAPQAPAEEEKFEFDVLLSEVGPNKIQVIKAIREITGLGLRESKEVVDNAPSRVREAVTREEAESVKTKLEAVGAVVEVT